MRAWDCPYCMLDKGLDAIHRLLSLLGEKRLAEELPPEEHDAMLRYFIDATVLLKKVGDPHHEDPLQPQDRHLNF